MRVFVCLFIFAGMLLPGSPQGFWQNRFGIVPVHSTRADVERLYGVSGDSCRCTFRTSKETIDVAYVTSPCVGTVSGWNVPSDTVLSFRVTPQVWPRLSDVALDLKGFVKRYSPED